MTLFNQTQNKSDYNELGLDTLGDEKKQGGVLGATTKETGSSVQMTEPNLNPLAALGAKSDAKPEVQE